MHFSSIAKVSYPPGSNAKKALPLLFSVANNSGRRQLSSNSDTT